MATTYRQGDFEVEERLRDVMAEHSPKLAEAKVRVAVLMADNPDGPAIMGGGYPALAQIKPLNAKERARRNNEYEAELIIDEREWRTLGDRQRDSLVCHELRHLDLIPLGPKELAKARAENSAAPWWKLDDNGMPRLKSVKGDWMPGDGFKYVVEQFGPDAIEYHNLAMAKRRADEARIAFAGIGLEKTLRDLKADGIEVTVRPGTPVEQDDDEREAAFEPAHLDALADGEKELTDGV